MGAAVIGAQAADYHWTGAAGDHLWSTAGNWNDSDGNPAAAAPTPSTAYTYNFGQRKANGPKVGWGGDLVVTQDMAVVIGSALALNPPTTDGESITFVTANGGSMRFNDECSIYVHDNSRLALNVDLSGDNKNNKLNKYGTGTLVFALKNPNAQRRIVSIFNGHVEIAEGDAGANIAIQMSFSENEVATPTFSNYRDGDGIHGLYVGGLGVSGANGRAYLNGTTLNVGGETDSTSTNNLPVPVFADGGTLAYGNERRALLRGLPIGGTLAVDRADVRVDAAGTAIRWLFDDEGNPMRDDVGAGARLLAPNGVPDVVTDPVRGKVLSISGGKYFKGPDANAGFAELQQQTTNNAYTVAFWFKPDASCEDGKIFFWGVNSNGQAAGLRLNNDAAKGLMFTLWGNNRILTTGNVRDGNWHHFAVTYNGNKTFRIYVDNALVDSFTQDLYFPPNKNFYIGRVFGGWEGYGTKPYDGLLDDFLIGTYEMRAEDIDSLYRNGLKATVGVGSVEARSAGEVAIAKNGVSAKTLAGGALAGGVTMLKDGSTLAVGVEAGAEATTFKGKISGGDTTLVKEGADYGLTLSGPAAAVTNVVVKEGTLELLRPLAQDTTLPAPVAHWTFDDDAAPGADSSANALDLAMRGTVTLEAGDAICGKAARFSSSSGYFRLNSFPAAIPASSDAFTVIVRYRPDTMQSSAYYPGIVMWGDPNGWNSGKLVKISVDKGNITSIRSTVAGSIIKPAGFYRTAMGTERSRWVTAAFAYSPTGKTTRLYADGEYVSQYGSSSDITAQDFSIGSNYAGAQNFYGLVDDVRIYGETLSAEQIRLIAERLEAAKGTTGEADETSAVLTREPPVAVAAGAKLKVSSVEAISSLSGTGTVEVSSLAELTVEDIGGFSGRLEGYGKVTVLKGKSFNRNRIAVANTLKVRVINLPMVIVVR